MQIDLTPFVVVDTETTGLRAGDDRIIEVAAVRMRGGRIESRFQQLINPERPIPAGITRLTGIHEGMVRDQPTADAVLPHLLGFLQGAVLVAHNLAFDRRFLDMELRRAGLPLLDGPSLCTLRLARRMLHALPSKSLSSLKRHFGIHSSRAHRALDDAEATALVLQFLIEALCAERTIQSANELVRLQYRPYQATMREPAHIGRLRRSLRDSLPETPGVYFHVDSGGRVLYVGKAKNLRHRVLSYFTAVENHPERLRRLVKEVRNVTWIETPSELVALLEESRLIKLHRPRFNRAQLDYTLRPLLRIDSDPERPRISLAFEVRNDGASYFGPLENRTRADDLIRIAEVLFDLTDHSDSGTETDTGSNPVGHASTAAGCDAASDRFRTFLSGRDTEAADRLRNLMLSAAAARRYEDAAWHREQLAMVEDRLARGIPIARSILDYSGVAVVPSGNPDRIDAVFVAHGRHQRSLHLERGNEDQYRHDLERTVAEVFVNPSPVTGRYREAELDEVRLVACWMDAAGRSGAVVQWDPGTDPQDYLEILLGKARTVDDAEEDSPFFESD